MSTVRVEPLPQPVGNRIEALVTLPDGVQEVLYISRTRDLVQDGTPWLAAQLPLAMKYNVPLDIQAPVDPEAMVNADKAQAVLSGWHRELSVVDTGSRGVPRQAPSATGVACFFSGGVDSFFTALRHAHRITHLVFVHGFDIRHDDTYLGDLARDQAREAATVLGKPLIEVSTNLRRIANLRVPWQTHYHGAALGAVGQALSTIANEFIVAGSFSDQDLHPWGTHPDLDRHWSGSRARFIHDSTDVTRPQKVRFLTQHQVALDHLRVCFRNPDGAFNCGRCEKCTRTMINLHTFGALGSCKTLPSHLDLERVRHLPIRSQSADIFVAENLVALLDRPPEQGDEGLIRALRHARRMGRLRRAGRTMTSPARRLAPEGIKRVLRRSSSRLM